jgi:hypothetical protein
MKFSESRRKLDNNKRPPARPAAAWLDGLRSAARLAVDLDAGAIRRTLAFPAPAARAAQSTAPDQHTPRPGSADRWLLAQAACQAPTDLSRPRPGPPGSATPWLGSYHSLLTPPANTLATAGPCPDCAGPPGSSRSQECSSPPTARLRSAWTFLPHVAGHFLQR